MKIIGCDFHPSYQQIALLDSVTGELVEKAVSHERKEEVRAFYAGLEGPVRVGIEASGQSQWFERMLAELGHEVWIGDAAKIRASCERKQKTDRRDAELLLRLLAEDRFPRIWVPTAAERDDRQLLPWASRRRAVLLLYLCEVRAGQYWRVDNVRSFDEFLERKFPEWRRKAYYLMAIHEQLPKIHKVELQQVGWAKATELAKVARRDGQRFDCATWLHKARGLPKEEFKREVSKHLTGKETEPWEILYFKAYKSQLPVIEQALETAGLMLGTDKSRGYCLEMICADFLAGVSLEAGNQDALLPCLTRLVAGLPKPQRKQLLEEVQVTF